MTITQSRPEGATVDETQVLFREARARRRRRWLIASVGVAVVVILALGLAVGIAGGRTGDHPSSPVVRHEGTGAATVSAVTFSMRPVLCWAPLLTVGGGQAPVTGPLPVCGPAHALTAANIKLNPYGSGYSVNLQAVQPDPKFAAYASTSAATATPNETVLLPGYDSSNDNVRYVLGPAGITASDVQSATVDDVAGQWLIDLTLTSTGARQWDSLAQQQFHALVALVIDGRVISAPLTQPTQSSFTSFHGRVELSGDLTEAQAKELAAQI